MEKTREIDYKKEYEKLTKLFNILEKCKIGNVVNSILNVYVVLEKYNIPEETFLNATNTVISETISDCSEQQLANWYDFFDSVELLEEIIVYRVSLPPYDFVHLFHENSDYSNSEIRDFIGYHCQIFGRKPKSYEKYL